MAVQVCGNTGVPQKDLLRCLGRSTRLRIRHFRSKGNKAPAGANGGGQARALRVRPGIVERNADGCRRAWLRLANTCVTKENIFSLVGVSGDKITCPRRKKDEAARRAH